MIFLSISPMKHRWENFIKSIFFAPNKYPFQKTSEKAHFLTKFHISYIFYISIVNCDSDLRYLIMNILKKLGKRHRSLKFSNLRRKIL